MWITKPNFEKLQLADLLKIATLATLLLACLPADSAVLQRVQKTFASPEEASRAFVAAAQNNDEKAILEILGPDASEIVSSGDPTEDAEGRANFANKYQEMHRFLKDPMAPSLCISARKTGPHPYRS